MRILTVIPISRGISKDTLTYFTKNDVATGSIVSIPLRKKKVFGLVTDSKDAAEVKTELKKLSYSIRKIDKIEAHSFLSNSFLKSAEYLADYYAGSVGAILSSLIPKTILLESEKLPYVPKEKPVGLFHDTVLLQSNDEDRYATYRSIIREEFAKNHSVFFCLPTTEDILNAKGTLEKGIEKFTYILHSGLPKSEIVRIWTKISTEEHPILIVATGAYLSVPRDDLGTIILDKESSRAYKMQVRPYLDIRTVALFVSKQQNIRLILGDMLLRIETLWQEKTGKYAELSPIKFRSLSSANCELVDVRGPKNMKKKEFSVFDYKLKDLLQKAKENNEHTFLFCNRKGLFPITACTDCGTVVLCKNCSWPVVLYGRKDGQQKNLFICHHCGERRDANELCIHCRGWRLTPLGIGIERVAEELREILPDTKVIIMDKDHVSTHKQAVKARDAFYGTPGSVMVGTELALTYLSQKIENTAVVSMDSLFAIPDFRINEKIFHILLSLRALAQKNMLVQTRQTNTKIFEYALSGNLIDFYRDEIEERKSSSYPPFAMFVKISLLGEKNSVKEDMSALIEFMKPYELKVYEAWSGEVKGKYLMHGLISLGDDVWIDKILLGKLRSLPPQYSIKIDPDSLL